MNKTAAKVFFMALETVLAALIIGICAHSLFKLGSREDLFVFFASCALRMLVIYIFALYYYFDLSDTYGSLELFMPLYILFATISEFKIFQYFSVLESIVIIPPQTAVLIFVFSTLMITTCLTGYEIFYNHNTVISSKTFIETAFLASIILSAILPKPQSLELLKDSVQIYWLCLILFAVTIAASLIQLFSNKGASDPVRHIGIVILMASHYMNIFYSSYDMEIISTAVFALASLGLVLALKIREENL